VRAVDAFREFLDGKGVGCCFSIWNNLNLLLAFSASFLLLLKGILIKKNHFQAF
jgi:hypothetical protein